MEYPIPLLTAMRLSDKHHFGLKFEIKRTYKHHHIRGTVNRLKVLKAWYLKILSGIKDYSAGKYFGITHLGGISYPRFKGSLIANKSFSQFIRCNAHGSIRKFLSVLNCYQHFEGPVLDKVPGMLKDDVLYTVPSMPPESVSYVQDLLTTTYRKHIRVSVCPSFMDKLLKWHYTSKRVLLNRPTRANPGAICGTYEDFCLLNPSMIEDSGTLKARFDELSDPSSPRPVQKLSIIGERGLKTRLVAVSRPEDLSLGHVLGRTLRSICYALPTDVSHNQEEGRKWVEMQQKKGCSLSSIDLKQASWHIPLVWQYEVLKLLKAPLPFVRLCLESDFVIQIGDSWHYISNPSGQAMGLPMSFPLFTLTLNLILMGLCDRLGIPYDYRILGDDIVLANPALEKEFLKLFVEWSIPISWDKTFLSNSYLAEFAGSLFYRGRDITPIRWTELSLGKLNSLYRLKPLIYHYYLVLGKYLWDICDTSTLGRKSKKTGREALYENTKSYRDILSMFRYVPSLLGGFRGSHISMAASKCHMKMAITYLTGFDPDMDCPVFRTKLHIDDASTPELRHYLTNCVEQPSAYTFALSFETFDDNPYYQQAYVTTMSSGSRPTSESKMEEKRAYKRLVSMLGEETENSILRRKGYVSIIPEMANHTDTLTMSPVQRDSLSDMIFYILLSDRDNLEVNPGFSINSKFRLAFLKRRAKRTDFQKLIRDLDLRVNLNHVTILALALYFEFMNTKSMLLEPQDDSKEMVWNGMCVVRRDNLD